MEVKKIIASLIGKLPDPSESIYTFTMRDLVTAIVRRTGEGAIELTPGELLIAREEVLAAISHYMDEREFIDMALDAWEIRLEGEQNG